MNNNLIIGTNGFIAQNLKRITNWPSTSRTALDTAYLIDILDMTNLNTFPFFQFKNVILAHGISNTEICSQNPKLSRDLNVDATINLLSILAKNEIKPIFLSSDTVYNGISRNHLEKELPKPIFEYARQKVEVENYIMKNFRNFLILRIPRIIGNSISTCIFSKWAIQIRNNVIPSPIEDQFSNPIYIDDLIDILVRSMTLNINGLFNCGGIETLSVHDLFNIFLKFSKLENIDCKPISISNLKTLEARPKNISMNSTKIYKKLDINLRSISSDKRLKIWNKLIAGMFN